MQSTKHQTKGEPRSKASAARSGRSDSYDTRLSAGATAGIPVFLQRKCAIANTRHSKTEEFSVEEQPLDLERDGVSTPIQKKMVVGPPDDPLEREADHVAEAATAGVSTAGHGSTEAGPGGPASCPCGGTGTVCASEGTLQRLPSVPAVPVEEPPSALPSGEGTPLNSHVRERVEPLLGVDLGGVRVHSGPESAGSAEAISARAYTYRNHIWLGPRERPDDTELLAHEAAHVVQQTGPAAGPPTLQRKVGGGAATIDGEAPRHRILERIREELGDDANAVDEATRPRQGSAFGESVSPEGSPVSESRGEPAAAETTPLPKIDRGELAAKLGDLEPSAHPDVDSLSEVAPQVEAAAEETTSEVQTPGEPMAPEEKPAAVGERGERKSSAVAAAEQAAGQADTAFTAAVGQMQPSEPPAIEPPRLVPPVDARGLPVLNDPTLDDTLTGVAEQAQTLRLEGLNLRQHAAEERGNAQVLRGNLNLVAAGVARAEHGVGTSLDHLAYRREVAETAQQSLQVSKQKAQTVAEQAPGFAEQADGAKAATAPMAAEAADMAGESAANRPDDPEAAASAKEQSGKINQATSDIHSTDQAIEQTQARAANLQQEAAQATELNTGTEVRLAAVESTLSSTEEKLASMQEQNASARGQIGALNSEPEAMLAQAQSLDQQGLQMLDASRELEQRIQSAQDTHESELLSLPEILPAQPDLAVQADTAPGAEPGDGPEALAFDDAVAGPAAGGNPEDFRYEDRESVDLASGLPSWFSGADPVSAQARAEAEQRERERRAGEITEISKLANDDVASIGPGQRAWIAMRLTGRHLFGSVSGIKWPGWGHLALGLIDPRGPLMGVVSGLSMMLSGGANLLSGEQWRRDPLGNLLKSAADIATGLTIILGSITALAAVIIAIMGAITLLTLGTAAPVTGPIIAFCASVMTTVGGWTLTVGAVALILQGLVLIKNLIDAACATTAEQLQNQSDKLTTDVGNAGNTVMQMGMAKLSQVGGRAMQAEIAEAGGGINFARTVGGVRTTGAGSYARAVGGVARSAPGRIARGAASLATGEGRRRAWTGLKGMFRSEGEPLSAREGFSRDFLVGRREPVPVAAGEAGSAAPRIGPAAEPAHTPRPTEPVASSAAPTHPTESPPAPQFAEPAVPHPTEPPPPPVAEPRPPAQAAPAETPRAAEPGPTRGEPAGELPRQVEPESGLARERSIEQSGHVESRELTQQQIANETRFIEDNPLLVQEGPPRNIKIGEHEWVESPGGGWCRHSNGARCVPRLRVDRGPQLTPENVDDIIAELRAKRNLTPAEEARLRDVAEQPGGIWNLRAELGKAGDPAMRGRVGHQLLGEDLPYARIIDSARIDPISGLATEVRSIKTHQLYIFQEEGAFAAQLKIEARELSRFRATTSGATTIRATRGTDRVLVIGVPPGTLEASAGVRFTAQWRAEALEAMRYAQRLRPPVRIVFRTTR